MTLAQLIKSHGFRVWQRKPDDSYVIYTTPDGKKIGYAQEGYNSCICTVHRPSHANGTGFVIHKLPGFTRAELEGGFLHAPHWAYDTRAIVKYADIEAYLKSDPWKAGYIEV